MGGFSQIGGMGALSSAGELLDVWTWLVSVRIQYTRTSEILADEGTSIAKASTGP